MWVCGCRCLLVCSVLALSLPPSARPSPGGSPAAPASPSAAGPGPPGSVRGNHTGPSSTVSAGPAPARPSTQRALAVLVVVSAAVIVYFVFRTIRTRRKNKKTRKYGVLDTSIGNMELTPLEQDDEDDDTLFDANQPRR